MRRMSFSLTERQYCDGSKDLTRRLGWKNAKPGDRFMGVRKAMGLKKGEKQVTLGPSEVISARREPLNAITQEDVIREGFPDMTPVQFVEMYCRGMRCKPETEVTRIEFRRVE